GQLQMDTVVAEVVGDDSAYIEAWPGFGPTHPVVGADDTERTPLADLWIGSSRDLCGLHHGVEVPDLGVRLADKLLDLLRDDLEGFLVASDVLDDDFIWHPEA